MAAGVLVTVRIGQGLDGSDAGGGRKEGDGGGRAHSSECSECSERERELGSVSGVETDKGKRTERRAADSRRTNGGRGLRLRGSSDQAIRHTEPAGSTQREKEREERARGCQTNSGLSQRSPQHASCSLNKLKGVRAHPQESLLLILSTCRPYTCPFHSQSLQLTALTQGMQACRVIKLWKGPSRRARDRRPSAGEIFLRLGRG